MIRATTRHPHCFVRRVSGRAVARRRRSISPCGHDVPPGCILGVLADDIADFDLPVGGAIELADGRLIVIAQLCPRHVLTIPVAHTATMQRGGV